MLIAGNWKMFKGPADARAFGVDLAGRLPAGVDVAVCVPYVSLPAALESGLTVYAQSVHWESEGAYTGEISAPMLLELGVHGALVGHSERRQYFGETDTSTARRAQAALNAGLRVIACVGETLEVREAGDMELVLKLQVEAIADAVGSHDRLVLAYEPVWAIGTGRTATPEQAQEAHAYIKDLLDVPVLYGGSVKPDNAAELLSQPAVDGALVGGASIEIDAFVAICEAGARVATA
jgi:triosephosphate isomerase